MLPHRLFARVASCVSALLLAVGVMIGLAWALPFFPLMRRGALDQVHAPITFAWLAACGVCAALLLYSRARRRRGKKGKPARDRRDAFAGRARFRPLGISSQAERNSDDGSGNTDMLSLSIVELPTVQRSFALQPHEKPATWSAALLRELEWKRFEILCIAFFESIGFAVAPESLGPLGGVVLKMHRKATPGKLTMAYCRAGGAPIDADELRDARTILSNENAERGFYLTPGVFTSAAVNTARGSGIKLIDGETLVKRLRALPYDQKHLLLELATEGDYRTPSCEICGSRMTLCARDKRTVWACGAYPDCRHRMIGEPRAA